MSSRLTVTLDWISYRKMDGYIDVLKIENYSVEGGQGGSMQYQQKE